MEDMVSRLENGEYRINFVEPQKMTMNFMLMLGSHKMRVISDGEFAFGIAGERETLLSWIKSVGIPQETIDEIASLMEDA